MRKFSEEYGFDGMWDFVASVFGLKYKVFMMVEATGAITMLAAFSTFLKEWVWDPPQAMLFIVVLLITESVTGALVSVRVKKNKFDVMKFYRTMPILVSHVLILAICYNMGKFEPILAWFTHGAFGWFATRTSMSIFVDLANLGFVKGEFVEFIKNKISKKEQE